MPILTDNAREGRVEKVRVLMDACHALRVSLIGEKLQVIVVLLFAKVIQSLEPVHIQVEVVAGQVQVATSGGGVTLELVMRSRETLRLTEKTERGNAAVRSTDGETDEVTTGHRWVNSQDGGKVEAYSIDYTGQSVDVTGTHLVREVDFE
jgi:hypothetical protein